MLLVPPPSAYVILEVVSSFLKRPPGWKDVYKVEVGLEALTSALNLLRHLRSVLVVLEGSMLSFKVPDRS